jgi:hypothetical protein
MGQSLHRSFALLALGFFLVAPGRAGDDKNKSPEDVFKAFAAAQKKEDVKTSMSLLTRDSQSAVAGTTGLAAILDKAFFGFMNRHITSTQKKEHSAAIDKILNRHGLSEDAMRRIVEKDKNEAIVDEENLLVIGELVKDKPTFVDEVFEITTKDESMGKKGFPGFVEISEAKVQEVKIDGQQAKSPLIFPGTDSEETKGTIYFKLETGVWKIDLIETNRNWPQAVQISQVQPHEQPQSTPSYSRPGLFRRLLDRICNR